MLRALQLKKAVLLEGSPGVGKTSLVSALATATGQPTARLLHVPTALLLHVPTALLLHVPAALLHELPAVASEPTLNLGTTSCCVQWYSM